MAHLRGRHDPLSRRLVMLRLPRCLSHIRVDAFIVGRPNIHIYKVLIILTNKIRRGDLVLLCLVFDRSR